MELVIILDLKNLEAWKKLPLIWKHNYSLPAGGNLVVVCDLIDVMGSLAFNGVKLVGVEVAWTLQFCFRCVRHDCMSSVFDMLFLLWSVVMYLLSSLDKIHVRVELIVDDVWRAEDDK